MYEDAFGGVRSCKGWLEDWKQKKNRSGQTSRKGKGMKCCRAHSVCVMAYVIIGTIFQGCLVL